MPGLRLSILAPFAALSLGACASMPDLFSSSPSPAPAPAPIIEVPPTIQPSEIIGRYGLAAYHKPEDEARTEAAARTQCKQPYVISPGPTGGVMMHLADQAQPEELRLKGAAGNRNFIGPPGEAGGMQDREVVRFDGRVLALRFVDPEVHGRYGVMVYVRCGAEGTRPGLKPPKPRPRTPGGR